MQVGVEIGGTFTDLVLADDDGALRTVKIPSTPRSPEEGALAALRQAEPSFGALRTIVHGSTIATNGVLERRGSPVGLIVTKGFRDVLNLQRQDRTNVYSLKYEKPEPLVRFAHVRELEERILATGEVLKAPSEEEIRRVVSELVDDGLTSIAVCLLHSYQYPEHELIVRRVVDESWPEISITLSHEITPEYREYERASTTVLSSYVKPIIDSYLQHFESELGEKQFDGALHIMQSNGGALPAKLIRRHAVRTLLSGPAGGVTAAKAVASRLEIENVITFDMGGTSTDVCLIERGSAELAVESHIDYLPIRVPMLDIVTVGAGGGSIARVDAGGMLRVGPESAGAEPGPACYGRGGVEATVTDANLVLGHIRPDQFLGGKMALDVEAAHAACAKVGAALGLDAGGAAAAIVEVANAAMLGALRTVSTERGVDPRRSSLLCYGGAGGQHAVALAQELGVQGVIVPKLPGLFSAYGLLIADLQRDWSASFLRSLDEYSPPELGTLVAGLREAAEAEFVEAGEDVSQAEYTVILDMRYRGQGFELEVVADADDLADPARLAARFHDSHRQRYGHAAPAELPEIVTVRLRAAIPRMADHKRPRPERDRAEPAAVVEPLRDGTQFVARDSLASGATVVGPAIVEEETTTVVISDGWKAALDWDGNLRVVRTAE
jgi:N-methylhydantoinase A